MINRYFVSGCSQESMGCLYEWQTQLEPEVYEPDTDQWGNIVPEYQERDFDARPDV